MLTCWLGQFQVLRIQNCQGQRFPLGAAFTVSRYLSLQEKLFKSLEKGGADKCWSAVARCGDCVYSKGMASAYNHWSWGARADSFVLGAFCHRSP